MIHALRSLHDPWPVCGLRSVLLTHASLSPAMVTCPACLAGIETGLSEAQLMARLKAIVTRMGYLYYHTFSSKRSTPGFPDAAIVHPTGDRTLYLLEIKTEVGEATLAQYHWLQALERVERVQAGVLRPSTLDAFVRSLPR